MPTTLNLTSLLPNALWLIFGLVSIFFIIATITLIYHWVRYGRGLVAWVGMAVYIFGSLSAILFIFNALSAYLHTL